MQKHRFSVGVLTELAPHEQPHLLGLNVGAGQAIKLRMRTDAYDGFRPYLEVRRVLCHELAHNVWSDHDNNVRYPGFSGLELELSSVWHGTHQFKELNSQLNREVAEFEAAEKCGTHYLSDLRGAYEPPSNEEAEALIHILGGNGIPLGDSAEDRRRRALEAATVRLKREEEELEKSCGTMVRSKEISRS